MEKSSNIKTRLLEVAKNKGISYEKFFKDFGTTYANFKGKSLKSSLRSEVLVDFSTKYPEIDLNWLITGEVKKESICEKEEKNIVMEDSSSYENNYKNKYIEVLEENRALNKKLVALMESNQNLKKR